MAKLDYQLPAHVLEAVGKATFAPQETLGIDLAATLETGTKLHAAKLKERADAEAAVAKAANDAQKQRDKNEKNFNKAIGDAGTATGVFDKTDHEAYDAEIEIMRDEYDNIVQVGGRRAGRKYEANLNELSQNTQVFKAALEQGVLNQDIYDTDAFPPGQFIIMKGAFGKGKNRQMKIDRDTNRPYFDYTPEPDEWDSIPNEYRRVDPSKWSEVYGVTEDEIAIMQADGTWDAYLEENTTADMLMDPLMLAPIRIDQDMVAEWNTTLLKPTDVQADINKALGTAGKKADNNPNWTVEGHMLDVSNGITQDNIRGMIHNKDVMMAGGKSWADHFLDPNVAINVDLVLPAEGELAQYDVDPDGAGPMEPDGIVDSVELANADRQLIVDAMGRPENFRMAKSIIVDYIGDRIQKNVDTYNAQKQGS